MQERRQTYSVTMDDDKLGLKPEVIFEMYSAIYSKARELAPVAIRNELRITQDGRIKTRFQVLVSDRMAPHLISAVQWQAESVQGTLKAYFYKLQEQVMSQMLGPGQTTFNITYDGKLF